MAEQLIAWLSEQQPQALGRLVEYGAALLTVEVEARQVLAERKIQALEQKYEATLSQSCREGLPSDASMDTHEDYVEWSGWQRTCEEASQLLTSLRNLLEMVDAPDPHHKHVGSQNNRQLSEETSPEEFLAAIRDRLSPPVH